MKRARAGLALLVTLLAAAWPNRAAAASTHGVRLQCDGRERQGSGVVVRDFRPGHGSGLLLMTALHVVEGCASLEPVVVTCAAAAGEAPGQRQLGIVPTAWSAQHPIEVLTWADFDLAAIVIPDTERALFQKSVPIHRLADRADRGYPPRDARIDLVAAAGFNSCPPVPATRRDVTTAYKLFESSGQPDWRGMLGTLAGGTVLMSYQSTAERGMSGGPVVWMASGAGRVLAIHLGGREELIQWGVLVGTRELSGPSPSHGKSVRLDPEHPRLTAPGFGPPTKLIDGNAQELAQLDLSLNGDKVQGVFETITPVDPFGAVSVSPQIAWSHEWFSPGFDLLHSAFATRVLVGAMIGRYRAPVRGDNGQLEEPLKGTARLPFYGFVAEIDAELHLARLAFINYAVSAGIRVGVSKQRYVEGGGTSFVWGPVLGGRAGLALSDRLGGFAQLTLSVQKIPVAACPIDCEGPATLEDPVWDVWGGGSVGVEFWPW